MRVMSLFAGYGGLDLALGMVFPEARTVYVSDIEEGPCRVLAHRFPEATNLGDVTAVDWDSLDPVDVVIGGSPCPDLSDAGRGAGMRPGTRSGLWSSMVDAIAATRPRLVVWENVRGAYSAAADSGVESCPGCMGGRGGKPVLRALGRVLGDLAGLGYDAQWCGLRAADVGACHGRYRVFVVAHPSGGGREQGCIAFAGCAAGSGHAGAPGRRGGARHGVDLLLPTPTSRDAKGHKQRHDATCLLGAVDQTMERFGRYAPAITRWERVLGRPAPAPTEIGPRGGTRLNPGFVEWMMGLPDGWVTGVPGVTRKQQLRMLGNGVVPQQAAEAIRVLAGVAADSLGLEVVA